MGRHRAVGCPAGYPLTRNSGDRSAVEHAYPWFTTIGRQRAAAYPTVHLTGCHAGNRGTVNPREPGVHRPWDASAAAYPKAHLTGYPMGCPTCCPAGDYGAVQSSPSCGPPTPGCACGSVPDGRLRSSPFIAIPWSTDPGPPRSGTSHTAPAAPVPPKEEVPAT